jgi:hypothetical protein
MYFKVLALHPFRVFLLHFCIFPKLFISDNIAVTAHVSDSVAVTAHVSDNVAVTARVSDSIAVTARVSDSVAVTVRVSDSLAVTAHARALAIKAFSCASPSCRMMQMLYFTAMGKQDSGREIWVSLTSILQCCLCATGGW